MNLTDKQHRLVLGFVSALMLLIAAMGGAVLWMRDYAGVFPGGWAAFLFAPILFLVFWASVGLLIVPSLGILALVWKKAKTWPTVIVVALMLCVMEILLPLWLPRQWMPYHTAGRELQQLAKLDDENFRLRDQRQATVKTLDDCQIFSSHQDYSGWDNCVTPFLYAHPDLAACLKQVASGVDENGRSFLRTQCQLYIAVSKNDVALCANLSSSEVKNCQQDFKNTGLYDVTSFCNRQSDPAGCYLTTLKVGYVQVPAHDQLCEFGCRVGSVTEMWHPVYCRFLATLKLTAEQTAEYQAACR